MLNTAIKVWFVFCVVHVTLYAFTGVALWSPLNDANGFARSMILFLFHISGLLVYPTVKLAEVIK